MRGGIGEIMNVSKELSGPKTGFCSLQCFAVKWLAGSVLCWVAPYGGLGEKEVVRAIRTRLGKRTRQDIIRILSVRAK